MLAVGVAEGALPRHAAPRVAELQEATALHLLHLRFSAVACCYADDAVAVPGHHTVALLLFLAQAARARRDDAVAVAAPHHAHPHLLERLQVRSQRWLASSSLRSSSSRFSGIQPGDAVGVLPALPPS